jgi:putative glutamine amidotransferase
MYRPEIGISLSLDDRGRWREGRSYHYIDRSYADAIALAGAGAHQLPIQSSVELLVDSLDGLLLPGGDDFPTAEGSPTAENSPSAEASSLDAELDLVSREQLDFDRALFAAASQRGIPILGICYGMQLIVLARGGKLDIHLPSERPEAQCHKLSVDERHAISIESTSLLVSIMESQSGDVNSLHHQAVRSVGPMHRVVATSADGIIEAIEHVRACDADADATWEIGVQWHPEKMSDPASRRLFKAFVDACRTSHENRANCERERSR